MIFTDTGLLTLYDHKGMWSIGRSYSKLTEELKAEAKLFRDALFAEAKKVKLSRKQIKKGNICWITFSIFIIHCTDCVCVLPVFSNSPVPVVKSIGT